LTMGHKKNKAREIPIAFEDQNEEEKLKAVDEPLESTVEADEQPDVESSLEAASVAGEGPGAADDSQTDDHIPDSDLQSQVDALARDKAALYDQLLRRAAEFENFRRRIERERSDAYQRARVEVLVEFLPVVDNFERALSSLENSGGDAEALRHGVELIHKQFKDALTKFGLEPVQAIGQTFDPHLHEAVTIEPTDKHKENTIIEEFQRGYKIGDKLLRPAKVKVAATPK